MIEMPQIVNSTPQTTAFIHLTVSRDEIRNVMGPGLTEIMSTLATQGITPTGPWFTHHLQNPGDTFDFEICVPVQTNIVPAGRVQNGHIPETTVARTIYHGPYEHLVTAWGEFQAWIAANGYVSGPTLWESYIAGPESSPDPSRWRTELNRPVTKR